MIFRKSYFAFVLTVFFIFGSGNYRVSESRTETQKVNQSSKKMAEIKGFRSARFGMKERDVYKAISKDFKISKNKIKRSMHPIEKTTTLQISVPELLEVGGKADIYYILGYKTKRLMQVNVHWRDKGDPAGIVNLANFLRSHFIKKQYQKDMFVANARLNDTTTIVFRGKDKKNRMALLTLTSAATNEKSKDKPLQELSLQLSYMLSITDQDIFTIKIKDEDF
jgi:hypothetical protein